MLVSDDSTDDAPGRIAQDLLAHSSARTLYVRNDPSNGMASNWNACIRLSSGRYVLVLHDDDFLYPDAISIISSACKRSKWEVGLFEVQVVGEHERRARFRRHHNSKYLPPVTALSRLMSHSSYIRFPGMVVARSAYEASGLFDETIGSVADLEMWMRLLGRYGLWEFSGLTAGYRIHSGALTSHMWEPAVLTRIDALFSEALARRVLPEEELLRYRAAWFYRFILAGVARELRNGQRERAREVHRLFETPSLHGMQSTRSWNCLRFAVSLLLR